MIINKTQERDSPLFSGLPMHEQYKLYMPEELHKLGENALEKSEPGCREAMIKAFLFVQENIGRINNAQFFIDLHDQCVKGVEKQIIVGYGNLILQPMPSEIQLRENFFPFQKEKVSEASFIELEEEKLISFNQTYLPNYLAYHTRCPFGPFQEKIWYDDDDSEESQIPAIERVYSRIEKNITEQDVVNKVDNFFREYNEVIKTAQNGDEKLKSIASLCRKLVIYHIFCDANHRTVKLLAHKLCIENNLSPFIPKHKVFDGYYSLEEMVIHLKEGQVAFQSLIN